MMIMRKNLLALLAAVALGAVTVAQAEVPVVSVDYGIETSTDVMLMPSSNLGSVVLRCDACVSKSFRLTGQTLYLVGTRPVTFAELGANLRAGGARSVMLFVNPDGSEVTRIVAPAAPVQSVRPVRK
jgi:hypothetical protein